MVKRLRHRPFTAVTRVRVPVGSPAKGIRRFPFYICGRGGIGRHARFRFLYFGVKVRVLSSAPQSRQQTAGFFINSVNKALLYGKQACKTIIINNVFCKLIILSNLNIKSSGKLYRGLFFVSLKQPFLNENSHF